MRKAGNNRNFKQQDGPVIDVENRKHQSIDEDEEEGVQL
jgi:hypothetical protein